jgi:hypothetical protein
MIALNGHKLSIAEVWQISAQKQIPANSPAVRGHRSGAAAGWWKNLPHNRAPFMASTPASGPLSGFRVGSDADLAQHQINLLHHLSVGQGQLFSEVETRAIMLARANTLARGFSGVREELLELLITTLNKNILPEIPSEGSVGASGDLVPLAHMARLLLVGFGDAQVNGKKVSATAALKKAGLTPLQLQCKEGLALVNGTSVMTGLAALATHEAEKIMRWSEFLTACLFQVMNGEPETLCQQIHMARGFRGQSLAARRITESLRTHPGFAKRIDEHQWGTAAKAGGPRHGNPGSVFAPLRTSDTRRISGGTLAHRGGRHPRTQRQHRQSADFSRHRNGHPRRQFLRPANRDGQRLFADGVDQNRLARRTPDRTAGQLALQSRPAAVARRRRAGSEFRLRPAHSCLATSLAAEARLLGTPASIQTISTNANNQDVVSMGTHAAKMTRASFAAMLENSGDRNAGPCAGGGSARRQNVMGGDYKKLAQARPRDFAEA